MIELSGNDERPNRFQCPSCDSYDCMVVHQEHEGKTWEISTYRCLHCHKEWMFHKYVRDESPTANDISPKFLYKYLWKAADVIIANDTSWSTDEIIEDDVDDS